MKFLFPTCGHRWAHTCSPVYLDTQGWLLKSFSIALHLFRWGSCLSIKPQLTTMAVWLASLLWGCCLCLLSAETANCLAHLEFVWVPGIWTIDSPYICTTHTLWAEHNRCQGAQRRRQSPVGRGHKNSDIHSQC